MISVKYIDDEKRLAADEGADALALASARAPVWVDVVAPTADECRALREALGLHELALEDALRAGHPPKLEEFEDHVFFIAHTPLGEEGLVTRKVSLFLSKRWLVTVVRERLPAMADVRARAARDPGQYLRGADHLAAMLLDHFTDGFEAQIEALLDRLEGLEDRALEEPTPATLAAILELRSAVSGLNRTVRSQRDVYGALQRTALPVISKKMVPYIRDVYDHVVRVRDLLEGAREGVAAARDAWLAASGNRMNEIMRTLTVFATILLPLSLITGFFGMNFENMPGLKSPAAFWITLGAMAGLAAGLLFWFRRRGWL